jgi:hypothetical protein
MLSVTRCWPRDGGRAGSHEALHFLALLPLIYLAERELGTADIALPWRADRSVAVVPLDSRAACGLCGARPEERAPPGSVVPSPCSRVFFFVFFARSPAAWSQAPALAWLAQAAEAPAAAELEEGEIKEAEEGEELSEAELKRRERIEEAKAAKRERDVGGRV